MRSASLPMASDVKAWASHPVGPGFLSACTAVAAAAHFMLATGASGFGPPHPMVALAGLAIAADLHRGAATSQTRAAMADWLLAALALLCCALPFRVAAAPALVCAAALAWRLRGLQGRAAAVMLMALGGWALKDGVWADLASSPVLWAEAHVTSALLGLGGVSAEVAGNRITLADGHAFIVLRACSVLSLAYPCAVGTYALCRLLRPAQAPGGGRVALALAVLVLLNSARLVAMVASPAIYDVLHSDTGTLPLQLAWAGIILLAAGPRWRRA